MTQMNSSRYYVFFDLSDQNFIVIHGLDISLEEPKQLSDALLLIKFHVFEDRLYVLLHVFLIIPSFVVCER